MCLNVIVIIVTVLVCVVLMCSQIYRNRREASLVSFSASRLPICLLMIAIDCLMSMNLGNIALYILPLNLILGIFPMWILSSSFLTKSSWIIIICWMLEAIVCIIYISVPFHKINLFTTRIISGSYIFLLIMYMSYFITCLSIYLGRVRNVVAKTTVWTVLVISVDVVYVFLVTLDVLLLCTAYFSTGAVARVILLLVVVALLFTIMAISYRISSDSLFYIMRQRENVILESMTDTSGEAHSESMSTDRTYEEIFERIVSYFESSAPYLNGKLVIDDLVKEVYANKLYVSRAISRCAGKNFCQFVNCYRIRHSMEIFRANPDLKVAELAEQSGFNSSVSFSMAFKLYMNENPSDWIRQERNRLSKSRPLAEI